MHRLSKNFDIERISLQHEINLLKSKTSDQKTKLDSSDEQHRNLTKSLKEINKTVDLLGKDLIEERIKCLELEKQINQDRSIKSSEAEV